MTIDASGNRSQGGPCFDGIEIGAVSVKWVRRTDAGGTVAVVEEHGGDPRAKLIEILERHGAGEACRAVVTGQAARVLLDLPYRSEIECLEKALAAQGIAPDVLVSLGGETFSVYPMKDGVVRNVLSTSKCAAGTGEFIVQQFQRMGLSLEAGLEESRHGKVVPMATRCSVHCKSDATHKLNKGECTRGDVARTLVRDLAKKVAEMVEQAQWPTGTVLVCGGVTRNAPFLEAFREMLPGSEVGVLPESPLLEAYGASLFAAELAGDATAPSVDRWFTSARLEMERLAPLAASGGLLDYRVRSAGDRAIREGAAYILGLDAGSTTTKAVLVNVEDGSVGASCYLKTLGNPVQAAVHCLEAILEQVGDRSIEVIQAGVTGSGRELVSVYLDNCPSVNEILAHARAAVEEVPEVDTVFEIGGQDAKYIAFLGGVPVDYAMNEGCSAGTGSFIEESASVDMGVQVETISGLAEASARPIAFGERCAAFINTDLRNALQQGASREDVVAGLAYSVADNYISRVVGARQVGENLLFLGGVALNRAVALAVAARTRRRVVVPPHPELMGCVGTALMVRDRMAGGELQRRELDLASLLRGELAVEGAFRCSACDNRCEIQRIGIHGKVYPFGGLCARFEILRHHGGEIREGRDLVALRREMMFEGFGADLPERPRGTIGLPMALTTYGLFPFYARLIRELGFEAVLSRPSRQGREKVRAAVCYPCELAHGAVHDLLERGVDFVLAPRVIEMEIPAGSLHSYACTSTTLIPDILRAAFEGLEARLLSPHMALSGDLIETTLKEIGVMGPVLGLERDEARAAGERALEHYRRYRERYRARSREALAALGDEPAVILAGRPYTVYAPEVNLALPRKIVSRGYHVIPADMLPVLEDAIPERDVWHYTQQISNAVAHAEANPDRYLCLVSCFSCGPDSSMYHYFRERLAGRTFCYLEIDSHTAHAGFETRVGAFLDLIDDRRRRTDGPRGTRSPLPRATEVPPPPRHRRSRGEASGNVRRQRSANAPAPDDEAGSEITGNGQPARLADALDGYVDSGGRRVEYDDPRVVHVWATDQSPWALRLVEKVYAKRGRRFRSVEPTTPEVMQYARRLCSGRECVPMTAIVGATLQDMLTKRQEDELTVYCSLDQQGPCQNGAWPLVWETIVRRHGLRNVVCGVWPLMANQYLGLGGELNMAANMCVLLGDMFQEAWNVLACLARDPEEAARTFEACFRRFGEDFDGASDALEAGLTAWAEGMAGIPLRAPVDETPKVLVFGGLNLLFVHRPVTDALIAQGVLPKVVPYSEGLSWLASESVVRYGFKQGLITPEEQYAHKPRGGDREEMLRVRQARFGLTLVAAAEERFRSILEASGLLFDVHVPFLDIASAGHAHASHIGFTETTGTVGRYLCALRDGLYDGLVNLGSFNCQPAMNAQAILRPLANRSDVPYVAIDCEGPWLTANQQRLLEAVAVQARRRTRERLASG